MYLESVHIVIDIYIHTLIWQILLLIKSRRSQYATVTIKQLMPKHFGRR